MRRQPVQWLNDDTCGGLPIMARPDHELILLTYGSAFFRNALRGDATFGYMDRHVLPAGVQNQNIHMSYDINGTRIIDNYEGHPITVTTKDKPQASSAAWWRSNLHSRKAAGHSTRAFSGIRLEMSARQQRISVDFREPLSGSIDLTGREVRVRAAEVFDSHNFPANPTGFRVGV